MQTKTFPHNPDHKCGTCSGGGEEMAWNVPRLGPNGGFVHKRTGKFTSEGAKSAQYSQRVDNDSEKKTFKQNQFSKIESLKLKLHADIQEANNADFRSKH